MSIAMAAMKIAMGITDVSATLLAGNEASKTAKRQSAQILLSNRIQTIKAKEQAARINEDLNKTLATQTALFAARGGIAGEGSALALATSTTDAANKDIDTINFNSSIEAINAQRKASAVRFAGKQAKNKSRMDAYNKMQKIGIDLMGAGGASGGGQL